VLEGGAVKLVTFLDESGSERLGVLGNAGVVDLAAAARARGGQDGAALTDAIAFLAAGRRARDLVASLASWTEERRDPAVLRAAGRVRLLAPVPRPPKIFLLAGNYAEHWREGGATAPPKANHLPEVFVKPVTTVVGPDAPIRLPGPICTTVDYEGELAVIIGQPAKNVSVERALDYVGGYANYDDISGRSLTVEVQRPQTERTGYFDWLIGKWFDTFGPLGPYLVVDEVADPQDLPIQTRVNGQVRQSAMTGDMIFTVAETIAWISRFVTLQPGDVIATGTPSGVGDTTGTYLQAGDVVEVEVGGLGVLRNQVVA
jgi:2-keto-4-pentenoate hydratase/2-oxohepta-3-ene-1,7-dioic acid hydratase in catechol pathway